MNYSDEGKKTNCKDILALPVHPQELQTEKFI
jgi:hypothetical protein